MRESSLQRGPMAISVDKFRSLIGGSEAAVYKFAKSAPHPVAPEGTPIDRVVTAPDAGRKLGELEQRASKAGRAEISFPPTFARFGKAAGYRRG